MSDLISRRSFGAATAGVILASAADLSAADEGNADTELADDAGFVRCLSDAVAAAGRESTGAFVAIKFRL